MKTIFKIVFTSFYLLAIIFSALSQVNYLSNEIMSALNSEDKKEIVNAEKIRSYGDELIREAESMEAGVGQSLLKKEDYVSEEIRQMDDKTLDIVRRSVRKKIRASNHYGNANLIMASIYTKNLKEVSLQSSKSDKEKINSLIEQSSSLMQKGRIIRGKALQINNEFLVYPHLIYANEIEGKAVNKLMKAYSYIYKNAKIDDLNYLNDKEELSEIKNIKSQKDLYFKVQIAASKESLSFEQLKKIYNADGIISSEFDNGWHKYSVKKNFKSYEEAFEYKESMNVKNAFILAFVKGKKVPVSEAVKLQNIKINTGIEQKNDKTVYRLQIGISTLPASNESMKKMNSGGNPVIMVDHGGWYTYTVGDFTSKQQADNYKKNNGLTNATVVTFKNGKPIENN